MNWIILIVAGLFESGFAFCLGKMKGLSGIPYYLWGAGFFVVLDCQHDTVGQSCTDITHRDGLSSVDRYRCCWDGRAGYRVFS